MNFNFVKSNFYWHWGRFLNGFQIILYLDTCHCYLFTKYFRDIGIPDFSVRDCLLNYINNSIFTGIDLSITTKLSRIRGKRRFTYSITAHYGAPRKRSNRASLVIEPVVSIIYCTNINRSNKEVGLSYHGSMINVNNLKL